MFSQSVSWWKTWYYNWRILVVLRGLEQATARRDSGAGVRCVWSRVLQLSHRCTSIFDIWRRHLPPFPCREHLKYCSRTLKIPLGFKTWPLRRKLGYLPAKPSHRQFIKQRFLKPPINEVLYINVHWWDNRRSLVWRLGTDVTVWRWTMFHGHVLPTLTFSRCSRGHVATCPGGHGGHANTLGGQ